MIFPVSGVETHPLIPFFVAMIVSFFTSMGGVSGAFLLLPFQMSFLGYTHPSVSATNQVFNIIAIPSGVYRYWREGRMVWPLTWVVIIGTLPGVFLGAVVRVAYLPDPTLFKLFAAAVLLYIGLKMAKDLLQKKAEGDPKSNSEMRFQAIIRNYQPDNNTQDAIQNQRLKRTSVTHFDFTRLGYTFYGEEFEVPFWGVLSLSLIVGIIGGIYGIGGGSIIAPFFVTFFGLPVYTVAGAALMGTFVTSVAGVVFYQSIGMFCPEISVAPDWVLGSLFGAGGMVGMYLGARCQKFFSARLIKWMLVGIIILTAIKYIISFLNLKII